jgi:nitrogen fixation protein FixH
MKPDASRLLVFTMTCCGFVPMPTEITLSPVARESRQFRLEGWHVLVILMAFFGIVGGVNAVMLRMALTTMPGLDARNGYDVSQRYNSEIARAHAQDQRGLKVEATLARAGEGARLIVVLRDHADSFVEGVVVSARLEHPALRARDIAVELADATSGRYTASIPSIASGGWTMVITVRNTPDGSAVFVSRNRIALGST